MRKLREISQSTGIATGAPWGGYSGGTKELDNVVHWEANALRSLFPGYDVEIRFNSDRQSGGAWLKTPSENPAHPVRQSEDVGMTATLRSNGQIVLASSISSRALNKPTDFQDEMAHIFIGKSLKENADHLKKHVDRQKLRKLSGSVCSTCGSHPFK